MNKDYEKALLKNQKEIQNFNEWRKLVLYKKIGLLLIGIIFHYILFIIFSYFTGIPKLHFLSFFLIFGPFVIILETFLNKKHLSGIFDGSSIIFNQFYTLFKILFIILLSTFIFFQYKYYQINGLKNLIFVFILSYIFQTFYYKFIKYYGKSEIILYLLFILGLLFFYINLI